MTNPRQADYLIKALLNELCEDADAEGVIQDVTVSDAVKMLENLNEYLDNRD